jgi:O-antigen ligase
MSSSSLTLQGDSWFRFRPALVVVAGAMAGVLIVSGGWIYAVGLLGIALLLRWPVPVALGSLAFLLPFDSVSSLGTEASAAALTRYVGGLAAVVLLIVGFATKRLSVPPRAALWWSLFVLWGAATLGWAANPEFAWERLPTALSLLLFYLIATGFRIDKKELSAVIALVVLGGCVAAVIASAQFYRGISYYQTSRSSLMMGGRETDPNQFGASLLLPLSLAVGGLVLSRSRSLRIVATLAVAILSFALMLSMSRGALVAALAMVFVYMYRWGFNRRMLIVLVCLATLPFCMPHQFFTRLAVADRGAGRFDIWTASMAAVPHYGLIGAGWNNFTVAYAEVAGNAPRFYGYTRGSHNIYLGMLIEVGIIGLAFLLLAFRSQLREARHRLLVPYEAACWGMVVMGLTLDIVWRKSFWFAWILLAMAARMRSEHYALAGKVPASRSTK